MNGPFAPLWRLLAALALLGIAPDGGTSAELAEEAGVAFLVPRGPATDRTTDDAIAERAEAALGPEARAALALARREAGAVLVATDGEGRFWAEGGMPATLERFRVVWIHEGERAQVPDALRSPASRSALRRRVEEGGALLLSGAALALVHDLGMETSVPRRVPAGTDRYAASIVPVEADHPVFQGLEGRGYFLDAAMGGNPREWSVPLTGGGYPAFADFTGTGG
ncbi:MAG: hypothetical protein JXA90_08840, partial [Planctomycetes bacterium]|nr:hypothetical protein [Planctomycetota bacterium]